MNSSTIFQYLETGDFKQGQLNKLNMENRAPFSRRIICIRSSMISRGIWDK